MGVSSEDELSGMIRFQNAYNAASRYITVIDEMLEKQSPKTRRGLFNKGLSDAAQAKFDQKLGKLLEAEANAFIKSYKGDNLEADLEKHLEELKKY